MNVKLTKRKAWELISRIHPRLNIKQEATPPDVAIFKASTGPEGLEIRFSFEEERLAAGLPINRTREFMSELRKRLEEAGFPQNK